MERYKKIVKFIKDKGNKLKNKRTKVLIISLLDLISFPKKTAVAIIWASLNILVPNVQIARKKIATERNIFILCFGFFNQIKNASPKSNPVMTSSPILVQCINYIIKFYDSERQNKITLQP